LFGFKDSALLLVPGPSMITALLQWSAQTQRQHHFGLLVVGRERGWRGSTPRNSARGRLGQDGQLQLLASSAKGESPEFRGQGWHRGCWDSQWIRRMPCHQGCMHIVGRRWTVGSETRPAVRLYSGLRLLGLRTADADFPRGPPTQPCQESCQHTRQLTRSSTTYPQLSPSST
jgi:hypothetical protein